MPPDGVVSHRFQALGSDCSLYGIGVALQRFERAESWVHALHARLTRFEATSELSQLNAAAGSWFPVGDELEELLRESLRAWELSGGLVNVAVLEAMHGIGYRRPLAEGPPTAVEFAEAVPVRPLPEVLEVVPGRARVEPGVGIDLGGLAKGWMADRLSERIGDNAIANLGGDLFALGPGPGGEGWPVEFGGVTVLLNDQGAATSSTRRRRWQAGEGEVHHLIDPRSGSAARSDLATVSVVAGTAARAEVCAKTALLLGSEAAPAFLAGTCQAWWLA